MADKFTGAPINVNLYMSFLSIRKTTECDESNDAKRYNIQCQTSVQKNKRATTQRNTHIIEEQNSIFRDTKPHSNITI